MCFVYFFTALQQPIAYQKELTKELSAPEFGNVQQSNSLLRKTQSQPTKSKISTLPKVSKEKKHGKGDHSKHARTKSIPTPIQQNTSNVKTKDDNVSSSKSPGSPTIKENTEKSSPKPKRGIFQGFKHTLRSKKSQPDSSSKSSGHLGAAAGTSSSQLTSSHLSPGGSASYANVLSATDSTTQPLSGTGSLDSADHRATRGSKQHSTDSTHSEEVS